MSQSATKALPPPEGEEVEQRPEDDIQASLLEHLEELRVRLKRAVGATFVGVLVSYAFARKIYAWLMEPVLQALPEEQRSLYFTSAVEPFFVYLKVACYAGIFVAAPAILYQVWAFVAPGLYRRERRMMVPFVTLGSVFFIGGALFARYIILPFAFDFLVMDFASADMRPMLTMREQLGLVLALLLAFGVVFEMPLVLTLLARMGVVSSAALSKHRRIAIVGNVVAAAILTPTGDPLNLALMALPMLLFYELGVLGARLVERRDSSADTAQD